MKGSNLARPETRTGSVFLRTAEKDWAYQWRRSIYSIGFVEPGNYILTDPAMIYPYDWRIGDERHQFCAAYKPEFDTEYCKVLLPDDALMVSYWTKIWEIDNMEDKLNE